MKKQLTKQDLIRFITCGPPDLAADLILGVLYPPQKPLRPITEATNDELRILYDGLNELEQESPHITFENWVEGIKTPGVESDFKYIIRTHEILSELGYHFV